MTIPHEATREEIEKRMDELAREYYRTKDPTSKRDLEELSQKLAMLNQLRLLEDALARCRKDDVRSSAVFAALDFLAARASIKWPFEQFRTALDYPDDVGRWQNLNASLNGIRRPLTPGTEDRAELTRKREWVFEPGRPNKKS